MFSGYGIAFLRGVLVLTMLRIFGIDNSSSSYVSNRKINFIVLPEEDTFGINETFGVPENKLSINFSKTKTKFCLS